MTLEEIFASLETPVLRAAPAAQPTYPSFPTADEPTADEPGPGQLVDAAKAQAYAVAGNATLTIRSKTTGTRFTYRIRAPYKDTQAGGRVLDREANIRFVQVMVGPDNESSYQYLGNLKTSVAGTTYWHGKKSRISPEAPSAKAFAWAWRQIMKGQIPASLEVWHEGRCGRCAKKLTVPESVASGFGPECRGHV